jgi:hypothetical protein
MKETGKNRGLTTAATSDVELINFGRNIWLDHSRPRSLVVALFSPRFFPVTYIITKCPACCRED